MGDDRESVHLSSDEEENDENIDPATRKKPARSRIVDHFPKTNKSTTVHAELSASHSTVAEASGTDGTNEDAGGGEEEKGPPAKHLRTDQESMLTTSDELAKLEPGQKEDCM